MDNLSKLSFILNLIFSFIIPSIVSDIDTQDYLKREHSLIKPYQGSGVGITYWDFGGNTMLTTNYIRLTADHQSMSGSLWNSIPCHLHNWELHVHFKIHGSGKDLYGDGLAIWYSKHSLKSGPVFGNENEYSGLGVFLDTYSNHNGPHSHEHPYISAMVNNGSLTYDHDRDGTHSQLAGCPCNFRGANKDTYLSIRFLDNVLTVSYNIDGSSQWKECFQVPGVQLPTGYFFGASARTGDLSDNHDIISMKLYELDSTQGDEGVDYLKVIPSAKQEEPRARVDDARNSSGWSGLKIFFVVILAIIGVGVCVVVGFVVFQKQQESSRKRFY